MFSGLRAEQARSGLTNKEVANALGIALNTYVWKKRTGKFYLSEICTLMNLFGCTFEELFGEQERS